MNNSFDRLIDGMCATLRSEVLTRLDDEFARGQVFGVINLLNTFKVRADWSAGFLLAQIAAQREAIHAVEAMTSPDAPAPRALPASTSIEELLALRDQGNRRMGDLHAWLDDPATELADDVRMRAGKLLREAMLAELSIELKNSPRPLFAEMSSGREDGA